MLDFFLLSFFFDVVLITVADADGAKSAGVTVALEDLERMAGLSLLSEASLLNLATRAEVETGFSARLAKDETGFCNVATGSASAASADSRLEHALVFKGPDDRPLALPKLELFRLLILA